MLEEQGRSGLIDFIKKVLGFLKKHIGGMYAETEHKLIENITQTGKKSVKSLVKSGADLEFSEEINNKDHLKTICKQCKKQGLTFGIKKTAEGKYQLVYQRKHSAVINDIVKRTIDKELSPKPKLSDILNKVGQIQQSDMSKKPPVKHREVEAR